MNYSKKEKQKPTAIRITKLSFVLLTSAVLVLSSVAAAQLFVSDNNAAFAAVKCEPIETDGTSGERCVGGSSNPVPEWNGGGGGLTACTVDSSDPNIQTCTTSGGSGVVIPESDCNEGEDCPEPIIGGGGGRVVCTFDPSAGISECTDSGGSGSKPVPDEGG